MMYGDVEILATQKKSTTTLKSRQQIESCIFKLWYHEEFKKVELTTNNIRTKVSLRYMET